MSTDLEGEELLERIAALKHDLGKSVAWTSANLEDSAWQTPPGSELMDALAGDLLCTGTRDGNPEPAWEVWARLTGDLGRPLPAPELEDVEHAVATLRGAGDALRERDPHALGALLGQIREAQAIVRTSLQALHRRLLRQQ